MNPDNKWQFIQGSKFLYLLFNYASRNDVTVLVYAHGHCLKA